MHSQESSKVKLIDSICANVWVFPKIRGTPKWMVYSWKTLLKWMIWGYHYFRKHPYVHASRSSKVKLIFLSVQYMENVSQQIRFQPKCWEVSNPIFTPSKLCHWSHGLRTIRSISTATCQVPASGHPVKKQEKTGQISVDPKSNVMCVCFVCFGTGEVKWFHGIS